MKAKLITFRSNKDGTLTLYFDKGRDKHTLLDFEGQDVEIGMPRETESEQYRAGLKAGRSQMFEAFKRFLQAEEGEQK